MDEKVRIRTIVWLGLDPYEEMWGNDQDERFLEEETVAIGCFRVCTI